MKRFFKIPMLVLILSACSQVFPAAPTPTAAPTSIPSLTPTPSPPVIWIAPSVPDRLREDLQSSGEYILSSTQDAADYSLQPVAGREADSTWIYTLVGPFATVSDGVSFQDLQTAWQGGTSASFPGKPILLTAETQAAFESLWGKAAPGGTQVVQKDELENNLWGGQAWGLVPFEDLTPRMKVLAVDGKSPLQSSFNAASYPLQVGFGLDPPRGQAQLAQDQILSETNFDPGLLTSVLMTGTTALVRSTAERMETRGISYPGEKIGEILRDADFTHISNEVSFTPFCPKPDPWLINLRFCSNPAYFPLLREMGVDIVELTGNHLLDYNPDAFQYSYQMYVDNAIKTYGGGLNLSQAREPLIIEHHGNRIAFIGCNPVGPDFDWASDKSPGAASCDFESMHAKIMDLSGQGILVIATLQDQENYESMPLAEVKQHLDALSEAGAVVVSGSHSHFPQGFSFLDHGFIHYGLGNLFFDQMDYPVVGTRREFYDKHFFYNGYYINTTLLTGMLEDYAQPRPMTAEERAQFLGELFQVSGW